MNRLQTVKDTRKIAAETLNTILQDVIQNQTKISEVQFRDNWLAELRKHKTIFSDGWYLPPPHGIGVLFGNINSDSRHNYHTLRPKDMWPRDDIFLDLKVGMAYLFASPVDKKTGIIGDFGLTIYFGKNQEVINHLQTCMKINKQIFDFIKVGMPFKDVYKYAEKIIIDAGLTNNVGSTTDPTGKDYGHTLPSTDKDWTDKEVELFKNNSTPWNAICELISKRRIFVNRVEKASYQPDMATTLEPRLTNSSNPDIPMASFHTVVTIHEDGSKELLTQFDDIFKTVGMNYM